MAARQVTVTIGAKDNFSSAIDNYNRKMGQAAEATKRVGESTGALESSMRRMQQAMDLGIAGGMLNQVKDFAEGMNSLGQAVNDNERIFAALSKGMGSQAETMARLRDETGGVVDDLTLLSGANKLLGLNIVDNNDDLVELYGNIQRLKDPAVDATTAIETFGRLLSNESVMLLDNFGLSSARVKDRIDELKNAGVEASDAFKQATFEEMDKKIERLGDAADVARTPLARLQADISNFWNEKASNFNTGLQATVGFMQAMGDYNGRQAAEQQQLETEAFARATVIGQQWAAGFESGLDPVAMQQFLESAVQYLNQPNAPDLDLTPGLIARWSGIPIGMQGGSTVDELRQLAYFAAEQNRMMDIAADLQAHLNEQAATRRVIAEQEYNFRQREWQLLVEMQSGVVTDPFEETYQRLATLLHEGQLTNGSIGNVSLFRPEDAARAEAMEQQLEAMYEQVKRMHAAELIGDDEFERLRGAHDEVKGMADEIERGADLLMTMNLARAEGLGSNDPLANEMADKFLDAARASGMAAEKVEELRSELALEFGTETTFSQALDDYIESLVAAGVSADEVAQRTRNLADAMRLANQQGVAAAVLQPANINYLAGGIGGGGRTIEIEPGDSAWLLSKKYDLPMEYFDQFTDQYGTLHPNSYNVGGVGQLNPYFDPQAAINNIMTPVGPSGFPSAPFETTGAPIAFSEMVDRAEDMQRSLDLSAVSISAFMDDTTLISDNFADANSILGEIGDGLTATFDRAYDLKVNLIASGPDWLKAFLAGSIGDFAGAMAQATTANGGTPPGQQVQGRSTRVIPDA